MSDRATGVPPLAAEIDDILACVHCGFCLPACPTYEVLGDENDSPRGRLYLMRAVAEGRLDAADPSFALHIDQCLGCRACEPVCPSGVRYGYLLERAREARAAAPGSLDRLARWGLDLLLPLRWVQNLSWWFLRALRVTRLPRLIARLGTRDGAGRFRFGMAMLAGTMPARLDGLRRPADRGPERKGGDRPAARDRDVGAGVPTVALLEGCVMSGLFGHVNRSTERVVRAHGGRTIRLPAGLCCGALHAHSGELDRARAMARRVVDTFGTTGADVLVTNSAGCGAALKEYGEWLAGDERYVERAHALAGSARDVAEWLVDRPSVEYGPLPIRVGYDAPCHLLHAQRVADAPLELLRRVPELEAVPLPHADRCCGAAGIYGLVQRRLARQILGRKLAELDEVGASCIATGNPGCLMQIAAGCLTHGLDTPVVHPVEILDRALTRAAAAL